MLVSNVYWSRKKPRKSKTQKENNKKQSEDNIITEVRNLFRLKKRKQSN